jgi:hypothetical protein
LTTPSPCLEHKHVKDAARLLEYGGVHSLPVRTAAIIAPRQAFNYPGLVHCASKPVRWGIEYALRFIASSAQGNLIYKWQCFIVTDFCCPLASSPLMPIAAAPTSTPKAQATTIWPAS